jgi:serine/threonine protein kinase
MTSAVAKAANRLLGKTLTDGWAVEMELPRTGTQTGGFFSTGYLAKNQNGRVAFLKAMDFSQAMGAPDFARAIQQIAEQFNFERDLLEFCNGKRMRNVVRSIGGGTIDLDDSNDPMSRVQYFLFEPAHGDVRKVMDSLGDITLAWGLLVLHQAALGLDQLHTAAVAHQDVKPSNLLLFENMRSAKVGDLGCASSMTAANPRDRLNIPGELGYAPPEQLYGHFSSEWRQRRIASDMYQLGSVAVFLFSGLSANALLATELSAAHHWTTPGILYADVLPFVRDAFGRVLAQLSAQMQSSIEIEVLKIIEQLCEPDIARRGDPRRIRRGEPQYTLEPYVSRLGNLWRSAEIAHKRKLRQ